MAVGKVGDRLELVGAAGSDMLGIVPKALNAEVGLTETLVFVEVTLSTEGESSTSVGAQLTLVLEVSGLAPAEVKPEWLLAHLKRLWARKGS
ncbi:hypothetical protein IVB46_19400 [Bradyrhizobium sp. 61]|uniref:hypothetical protein n=1 Tax=unclassified Bradyrhizobium TaxID=2631580 RepID=UPI001FFB6BE2|nr:MULTISPECIES: hypothetical protein [unclassified Bradyrhizobium]MCK1277393.1 hypothetical protein [Bradyrhizobium sp. 61]MCK1447443.1 hypothetical protein [Bradyrhizobium sp. 48]